jgi:hypothetical protein
MKFNYHPNWMLMFFFLQVFKNLTPLYEQTQGSEFLECFLFFTLQIFLSCFYIFVLIVRMCIDFGVTFFLRFWKDNGEHCCVLIYNRQLQYNFLSGELPQWLVQLPHLSDLWVPFFKNNTFVWYFDFFYQLTWSNEY